MKDRSILLLASAIIVAAFVIGGCLIYTRGESYGYNMMYGARYGRGMMYNYNYDYSGSSGAASGASLRAMMPRLAPDQTCLQTGGTYANSVCTCAASTTLSNGLCTDKQGLPAGNFGVMMQSGAIRY